MEVDKIKPLNLTDCPSTPFMSDPSGRHLAGRGTTAELHAGLLPPSAGLQGPPAPAAGGPVGQTAPRPPGRLSLHIQRHWAGCQCHRSVLSLSLSLSLSHCHCHCHCHCHTVTVILSLSHCHCHCHTVTLSLSLSQYHTDKLSHRHTVTLSSSHTVKLLHCETTRHPTSNFIGDSQTACRPIFWHALAPSSISNLRTIPTNWNLEVLPHPSN